MQIVVVAPTEIKAEFKQKFTSDQEYIFVQDYNQIRNNLKEAQVVFDFFLADFPDRLKLYSERQGLMVFCHAVNISLGQLIQKLALEPNCVLFGFNGWPGMINRPYLEVTVLQEADIPLLEDVCTQLGTQYLVVDDRVGMVTPRVLAMLVNEAFYTLQDGIATAADIDLAMQLGNNYPYGPLAWAEKIGLKNIYHLLESMYTDTQDERYKICPLLKKRYLQEFLQP